MQIALFVIPVLVLLGWCIGQPLSLDFQVFECVTVFLAVILANTVISEGKSHWMQGLVLLVTYVAVGAAFLLHGETSSVLYSTGG